MLYSQLAQGKTSLWILPPSGSGEGKPRPFSRTSSSELSARISPDGHWVAYESDESGKFEVYVAPFSGTGGKSQVSSQGARHPEWSRTGRELFYVDSSSSQLMAVDVPAGPLFRPGHPHALFKLSEDAGYDVTPDPTSSWWSVCRRG
jgi:Tol biopolymer transport system component